MLRGCRFAGLYFEGDAQHLFMCTGNIVLMMGMFDCLHMCSDVHECG